ncbi:MAG TPA: hypothetical protein ENN84_06310 [Candidatus Marinimicrobia bacterium]|nr:hypothetical protein [Candidatus Neomarinimicrobiota bacterium]
MISGCSGPKSSAGNAARGLWYWQGTIHAAREDAGLVQHFKKGRIQAVYGAFGYSPYDYPERMKAWNALLHSNEMQSQYLLAGTDWFFPEKREEIFLRLEKNLIEFHKKCQPQERFDAIHLDIEPQALPQWKSGSPQERRELLRLLSESFEAISQYLNRWSDVPLPIYADLPVWFDSFETIGWESENDRDAWFYELSLYLDGVSLMAYERTDKAVILADTEYEFSRFRECRIALEADIGHGKSWRTPKAFFRMIEKLESAGFAIDIHNWESYVPLLD